MFFDFAIYQKFKGGTLIKCLISVLSNLADTLQRISATIGVPEGLENTPLNWFLRSNTMMFKVMICE